MGPFSTELRSRRTKMKLSQREAARQLGTANSMVHRYERGIGLMEMSVGKATALADFFRWNFKDMVRKMREESKEKK